jgi:small subunit ribosomal protein S17
MAKTLTGIVSSSKADKTIVITVTTRKTHPLYKKQYTVTTKYMAHDENNDCQVGDKVMISETRPYSARKHFKLDEILQRATLTETDLAVIKTDETAKKKEEAEQTEEKA